MQKTLSRVQDKQSGEGTTSNTEGFFEIELTAQHEHLIITYTGYIPQSLHIHDTDEQLTIILEEHTQLLDKLVISRRAPGTVTRRSSVLQTQQVTRGEIHRADYSSRYGFFVTPRLHLKYNPAQWVHLRGSVGKGFRTANVLAENNYLLASSRRMEIAENLDQKEAWNAGVNATFYIPIGEREITLTVVNRQITRFFRNFSVYLGAENLFNFRQEHPIIDAANPRSDNFDATMVWGPVHGRKILAGLRYNIPRD